jgi:hypothetical protein
MGDQNTILDAANARHLIRRAGFGAPLDQVASFTGMTRGEAADELLNFTPANFRPNAARNDRDKAHNKWLKYMIKARFPLQGEARPLLARPLSRRTSRPCRT